MAVQALGLILQIAYDGFRRHLGATEETRHVRFSVWSEAGRTSRAEAAVSLADEEAERLARFLAESAGVPERPTPGAA
jgi:hypothetical protein